jgi:signal transduction histidine kinase
VRIEQRTRELSQAKARAEAAVKARDEFFSMASHELKTPLAALKLQTQIRKRNIARGNFSEFSPENLPELCSDDERQVERLAFLVDNMLDVSKITSGNLTLNREPFDLRELVADVCARLRPILSESGNELSIKADYPVRGSWDRHRLEQVFTNLLTNAGKYAPGRPVDVEVSLDGSLAKVAVRDRGRGISPEDQKRIFKSFERVRDRGETSGLGLGLYITKQIVEAHRGDVRVESELGKGSTFTVELPTGEPADADRKDEGRA